jgi:hypothetical protein
VELFEEIYGSYFQAVRRVLMDAKRTPLTQKELEEEIRNASSLESSLVILPKLLAGAWSPLLLREETGCFSCALDREGTADMEGFLKLPLTKLQKSWIKALLPDPRFRIFFSEEALATLTKALEDIPALYDLADFHYFDRYTDGDPYEDPLYRECFQTALKAMAGHKPLLVAYESRKGTPLTREVLPCRFQYSPKDDKFRILSVSLSHGRPKQFHVLNMARIRGCHISKTPVPKNFDWDVSRFQSQAREPVQIRIYHERNALERCMLRFAHYEKQTTYEPKSDTWLCSIYYDPADETELLIELLSFGPVIRILGPEAFLLEVRRRVKRQHELFYSYVE